MLGAHSFQKTPHVDTPEDEHPLETLFALFVTLRYDEGNPSGCPCVTHTHTHTHTPTHTPTPTPTLSNSVIATPLSMHSSGPSVSTPTVYEVLFF